MEQRLSPTRPEIALMHPGVLSDHMRWLVCLHRGIDTQEESEILVLKLDTASLRGLGEMTSRDSCAAHRRLSAVGPADSCDPV